jgi:alpha-glucosidase
VKWAADHAPESGLLSFHNGNVLVLGNFGFASAPVPEGYSVVLSSGPEPAAGWSGMDEVPVDCAAYLTRD